MSICMPVPDRRSHLRFPRCDEQAPEVLHIIPDTINGYFVPRGYHPTDGLLVWCIHRSRFGVYRKQSGWVFHDTASWRAAYRSPTPPELGLRITDMALVAHLTANSRRRRPQHDYLGAGTLRDALIRGPETFAAILDQATNSPAAA